MSYAYKVGDNWIEIAGPFTVGADDAAIQYAENWPDLATTAQRNKLGVKAILDAPAPPANVKVVGQRLIDFNGAPKRENILEEYTPAEAGAIMWERAKAIRDTKIDAGAPTAFGVADADIEGRLNISGAVQMALLAKTAGGPFSIGWTMNNNSVVQLDADQMIAVGMAVGQYVATLHAVSQAIRKAIQTAVANGSSAQTIFQISVTAGYPNA